MSYFIHFTFYKDNGPPGNVNRIINSAKCLFCSCMVRLDGVLMSDPPPPPAAAVTEQAGLVEQRTSAQSERGLRTLQLLNY